MKRKRVSTAAQISAVVASALILAACGSQSGTGANSDFCSTHTCIGNFDNGNGYVVQCADGTWSHSGGESGACSYHGGEG